MNGLVFTPSDFVAVFNQTLETAYPSVAIEGELANFRVSKGKWVYFDLKDDYSALKFFASVYQLPGPLEDGLMLRVVGTPKLHPAYGFSINAVNIQPIGEGSIKKAAALLEAKLAKEGLFDESRKRHIPYPPRRVGLVTSSESAAYKDFMKILKARWGGLEIVLADVLVQGEKAPGQIIGALDFLNTRQTPFDVIVITRGGGSPEDLAAFNTEGLTRAVAGSRVPTVVAVGHESDISLAELAADKRASTPSNAAELLVPDKRGELEKLAGCRGLLLGYAKQSQDLEAKRLKDIKQQLDGLVSNVFDGAGRDIASKRDLLSVLSPAAALNRGYAIIRHEGKVVTSAAQLKKNRQVDLQVRDGQRTAIIK